MAMLTNHRNLHDDNYDDNQVDDNVDNHDDTTQPSYYLKMSNTDHTSFFAVASLTRWRVDMTNDAGAQLWQNAI